MAVAYLCDQAADGLGRDKRVLVPKNSDRRFGTLVDPRTIF